MTHCHMMATNTMAMHLGVKPPSVTAMVQVLSELGWAEHRPYRGARLTPAGRKLALSLVRKHRLWETFLVERLGFGWEEVHDIAEQLEHVDSVALVNKLDAYLGHPKVDPHGDPIPNAEGEFHAQPELVPLGTYNGDQPCAVAGVKEGTDQLLSEMSARGLALGTVLHPDDRERLPAAWHDQILVEPHPPRNQEILPK
ncbi:MAG: metal-dependent transcriptional regulator [Flavobacteriales bacterium]